MAYDASLTIYSWNTVLSLNMAQYFYIWKQPELNIQECKPAQYDFLTTRTLLCSFSSIWGQTRPRKVGGTMSITISIDFHHSARTHWHSPDTLSLTRPFSRAQYSTAQIQKQVTYFPRHRASFCSQHVTQGGRTETHYLCHQPEPALVTSPV